MIRPSALALAEICGYSALLGERHAAEGDEAKAAGNAFDAEVGAALCEEGGDLVDPAAQAAVVWVRTSFPHAQLFVQRRVRLEDPETGETLTEGTTDLLAVDGNALAIVDWKKIHQIWTGYVNPYDHLQSKVYLAAAMLELGADAGQQFVVGFDERKIYPYPGPILHQPHVWQVIDRVRAIQARPRTPFTGPHCQRCWQRTHCDARMLPAVIGRVPVALQPFIVGTGVALTADNAPAALEWLQDADGAITIAEEIRERVVEQLKAYAAEHGPITTADGRRWGPAPTNGKRSGPSLAELEAKGLTELIRPGRPGTRWGWL
jgi:hypothetical protein